MIHCAYRIHICLLATVVLLTAGVAAAEEVSEAQRAWEARVGEKAKSNPAFAWVEDDPALPRVLLIGDSISIGYTAPAREALAGEANIHRIPVNGGDTRRGLENLDAWLGEGKWDVIHFNWGLHDLKRLKDGQLDASSEREVALETYAANLRTLVERLKATGATLIWCATTPVPEGSAGRIPGDEVEYNAAAAAIMAEEGVRVNDLYGHVKPVLDAHQRPANVHFSPEGSEFLGKRVAEVIRETLAGR